MNNLSLGLSFLAGMASFLSPCVFSLIPAYVSYLGGRSLVNSTRNHPRPEAWTTAVKHGLVLLVGFSIVFTLPRLLPAVYSGFLYELRDWISRVGGGFVILFGLRTAGFFSLPVWKKTIDPFIKIELGKGYLFSLFIGMFLSAGWAPCIGPVLGMILTRVMNGSPLSGTFQFLSSYSIGLSVPFILLSFVTGWLVYTVNRHPNITSLSRIVAGALLIMVGGTLLFGTYQQLARYGFFIDLGL